MSDREHPHRDPAESGRSNRFTRRRTVQAAGGAALLPLLAPRLAAGNGQAAQGTPPGGTPAAGTPSAGQALPMEESIDAAFRFIAMSIDAGGTGGPRLARSYFGGPLGDDGFDVAFVYDNALAIISLVGRGEDADLERATALADGILFAQETDPEGDGRIRDGYTPDPFVTPEGTANIAFSFGQSGTSVGNMAWAAMALCHVATVVEGDVRDRAITGAVTLATWVEDNAYDETGPGGYRFGLLPDGPLSVKSIEHNTDLVALFAMLDALGAPVPDGTPAWADRRAHALGLVEAMWNADEGYFWTGTTEDLATPNPAPIPEDAQTWTYLALLDDRYAGSIDWCADNLAASDGAFTGVSFSDADTSRVWFEGTAHLAAALFARDAEGDADAAGAYLDTIRLAQVAAPNADGEGIVAASEELDTGFGFSYFPSRHLGATAWYLMAALGVNPFVLPGED
ncbi:MAG: hypothetical protein AVDCRST_MAG33-1025 [uncultured Thermomicrobiales bacterium]|uniref:Tat pathway signal sequence domain protein n=1 Tax=uncultured Thermomicrobiales bacterium TaxID=1645740 RepID=A0A6J4ULR7_9BACT|nr:MAG: hypothetical protein AVDCRST_MAG33-1025 [uncultured Thermomicrobiales bacterium]